MGEVGKWALAVLLALLVVLVAGASLFLMFYTIATKPILFLVLGLLVPVLAIAKGIKEDFIDN